MEISNGLKAYTLATEQQPKPVAISPESKPNTATATADKLTISPEAIELLAADNGTVSPLSAGGTTLPPWPPKQQN